MNILKKISIVGIITLITAPSYAQNVADGLRFSQTLTNGTARFVSMGGAFGSLGADFSSISINPAGLGVYKSGEFTFTPSFKRQSFDSDFLGISASDSKNKLYIDNLGIVLNFKPYKSGDDGIQDINFAFGYNRTNDFHSNSIAIGNYDQYSIMDYFASISSPYEDVDLQYTNDNNPFETQGTGAWESIMAWNTWLLYDHDSTGWTSSLHPEDLVSHQNVVSTEGSMGEYEMAIGANISNKFYLGTTLGITNFSYTYNNTYSEDAYINNTPLDNNYRFNYLDYNQYIETKGTGFNLKIGGIYTPTPSIRIGAAVHTPTFYSFSDDFSYSITTNFDTTGYPTTFSSTSPLGKYDYKFETPFKFIGSFAYVYKQLGLLSADIEYVDYSSMRFRDGGDGYSFWDVNQQISQTFKNVLNIRVGGEVKLDDFSIRAGYSYYPSPYKSGYINSGSNIQQFSAGFGYRSGNFFIDMAYQHTLQKAKYLFYDDAYLPTVNTTLNQGKVLLTLGFRY
ncbi:MAG TPA: hypothetical protein PLA24_03130 [Tenuifilaceae bacterium]|nr:hypothetical protein [Tenuifilaceae bacterium]